MRMAFIIVMSAVIVSAAVGIIYVTNTTSLSSSNYTIVKSITVYGRPAGFPCAALGLPCALTTSQSSEQANLVLSNGKYYYDSNIMVNNIVYSVWYDNSTYYCVSPKYQSDRTCPP
jgi:hypothetical protein